MQPLEVIAVTTLRHLKGKGWHFKRGAEKRIRASMRNLRELPVTKEDIFYVVKSVVTAEQVNA